MRNQPTIIKQMARALSELKLEEGRIYKSNTIWSAVRRIMGMSVTDTEWKRVSANIKRQLVDIGAIERVPGKYQMKVLDCEAIATFTRTYTPHQNPRQPNLFQGQEGQSKPEDTQEVTKSMDSEVTEIGKETRYHVALTLSESTLLRLLVEGEITLKDLLDPDED